VGGVVLAITVGRAHPLTWLGVWQIVSLVGLFLTTRRLSHNIPVLPPGRLSGPVIATTLGVGTLQALWGFSDVLFAKASLPVVQAGWYTGLSTIGQALPFIVGSLSTVMLTAVLDDPRRRRGYLTRTLIATAILSVLFLGVLFLFPVPLVRLSLGSAFIPLSPYIQRYSDAMACMALVLVMTTYGVALGSYRTMTVAALGTGIWLVSLSGAHTMAALVNRTLVSMLGTLVLVGVVFVVGKELRGPLP
jgi:O-antigen/teichoic acid export membrane protein